MAEFASMKVSGLKEIEQMMKKLPKRNQKKIKRQALRQGGDVIREEQRKNIDQIPNENLGASGKERFKKSVGIVTSKSRLFESKVYVGPRYANVKHTAPDAHLIEFGTEDRYTKDGAYRGRIEATPFVRPAWEAKKRQAVEDTRRALVERTINEAKKLRRG